MPCSVRQCTVRPLFLTRAPPTFSTQFLTTNLQNAQSTIIVFHRSASLHLNEPQRVHVAFTRSQTSHTAEHISSSDHRGLVTRTLHTLALMRGTACVKTGRLKLQTAVGKPDWDHSPSAQISGLPSNSCRLERPFSTSQLQLRTISSRVRYQVIIWPSWLLQRLQLAAKCGEYVCC